jgi:hypothetical protein
LSWKIDLATSTATHESGLAFKFTQDPEDAGAWDGQPQNLEEWLSRTKAPFSEVARLAREAGSAYLQALKGRH